MAITVTTPVVVPATPAVTYNTILVLRTTSVFNPATCALQYTASVGLGASNGKGGYNVLPSSIKTITIKNMWVDGTATEQTLAISVVETLKERYEALTKQAN